MSDPLNDGPGFKTTKINSSETAAQIEKVGLDGDDNSRGSFTNEGKQQQYTHLQRQRNPYLGKSEENVITDINALIDQYELADLRHDLVRGAQLAYNRDGIERLQPSPDEKYWIEKETSTYWKDKWIQTWMMYYVAILCGSAAIVQGMDQTAVNGAQL